MEPFEHFVPVWDVHESPSIAQRLALSQKDDPTALKPGTRLKMDMETADTTRNQQPNRHSVEQNLVLYEIQEGELDLTN